MKRRGLAQSLSVRLYHAACILASIPVVIGMTAIGTVHRWRVTLPMPSEVVGHKLVLVWKNRQGFLLADSSARSTGASAVSCLFFFPSCASVALARSSHIVVLMNELTRCNFNVPPWGVESGVRTVTQSEVLSG